MGAIAANTIVSWTDSDGADHDGSLVTRAKGFDVIACAICGFRHVIPLPDAAELESTYRDAYYTEEKPMFLAHAGEDEDWAALARPGNTAVFYMGLARIGHIAAELEKHGAAQTLPAAVILGTRWNA